MAKRYCISPVVGAGTFANPYRPAVADVCPATALIPSKPDGSPKYRFAFCLVATDNLSAVLAVSNLYALPDYPLDGRMDGMESDARLGLVQSAGAYDLDGLGLHPATAHTDSDGYRDVLTRLARTFEPAFSVNSFDVRES